MYRNLMYAVICTSLFSDSVFSMVERLSLTDRCKLIQTSCQDIINIIPSDESISANNPILSELKTSLARKKQQAIEFEKLISADGDEHQVYVGDNYFHNIEEIESSINRIVKPEVNKDLSHGVFFELATKGRQAGLLPKFNPWYIGIGMGALTTLLSSHSLAHSVRHVKTEGVWPIVIAAGIISGVTIGSGYVSYIVTHPWNKYMDQLDAGDINSCTSKLEAFLQESNKIERDFVTAKSTILSYQKINGVQLSVNGLTTELNALGIRTDTGFVQLGERLSQAEIARRADAQAMNDRIADQSTSINNLSSQHGSFSITLGMMQKQVAGLVAGLSSLVAALSSTDSMVKEVKEELAKVADDFSIAATSLNRQIGTMSQQLASTEEGRAADSDEIKGLRSDIQNVVSVLAELVAGQRRMEQGLPSNQSLLEIKASGESRGVISSLIIPALFLNLKKDFK